MSYYFDADKAAKKWENRSVEEILVEIDSEKATLQNIIDEEPYEDRGIHISNTRGFIEAMQRLLGRKIKSRENASVADEIDKLYKLMKKGIITQSEFDIRKKRLLEQ